jgi:hypothetical protein
MQITLRGLSAAGHVRQARKVSEMFQPVRITPAICGLWCRRSSRDLARGWPRLLRTWRVPPWLRRRHKVWHRLVGSVRFVPPVDTAREVRATRSIPGGRAAAGRCRRAGEWVTSRREHVPRRAETRGSLPVGLAGRGVACKPVEGMSVIGDLLGPIRPLGSPQKRAPYAAAIGARRLLRIVTPSIGLPFSRGIAPARVAPHETKLWPRGGETHMSDARPT